MTERDALDAAIDTHPEQAQNYLVLADWLQQQQDPLGELIVLYKRNDEDSRARRRVLERELGPPLPRHGDLDWFYGFVRRMRTIVDDDDVDELRAQLAHATLRHLTSLDIQLAGGEHDERQWIVELIANQPRPCWRTLEINSYWRGGNDPPAGELALAALYGPLPRLSRLTVHAHFIDVRGFESATLEALSIDGKVADIEPILALPNLCELELTDVSILAGSAIAKSPLAARLAKLVLPHARKSHQDELRAMMPYVTFFPEDDSDRYARVGE